MEAGRYATAPKDVQRMLDLYGVTGERDRDALVVLARESGQRGWWYTFGDALPDWFEVYVGLETEAARLDVVETHVVPGLLQTEAYATTLIRTAQPFAPAEEVARQVALRQERQRRLRNDEPIRLRAVIGEAVLRCQVGSPRAMHDQLVHLADVCSLANTEIRVLPFASPQYAAFGRAFIILGVADPADPGLVYADHRTGALYIDDASQIQSYKLAWDYLVAGAMSPADSLSRIRQEAELWK
jgi:hypothetical protein